VTSPTDVSSAGPPHAARSGTGDLDLAWTPEQQEFRQHVSGWLAEHKSLVTTSTFASAEESIPVLREWERLLASAGLNAVSWPEEFGGRSLDPLYSVIFNEEYELASVPRRLNYPALGLLGPTLMLVGTPHQQTTFIPRILTCEDIWCQGFSEPNAGSDLASLTTKAERDGEEYVVSGQKTWCSNGPRATHMFALVRTDPAAPKHKGISYLLIDLRSPGVEVKPIRQISGASLFSEVFLTDVRVPVANRLGAENDGWNVTRVTLGIERDAARYPALYFQRILDEARAIAVSRDVADTGFEFEFARLQAAIRVNEVNFYAGFTSSRPEAARDLASMGKLARSLLHLDIYELGMRALGPDLELGAAGLPDGVGADWHERYWHARASTIYAGTTEIQRNLIAERLLGLPRAAR
jgi:alkylation response protein AidB-like acyl-CoA dehydrogenase